MKIVIDVDLDVPVMRKLFFCLPLRLGLLVWGYIHFILAVVILLVSSFMFCFMIERRVECLYIGLFILTTNTSVLDLVALFCLIKGLRKTNGFYLEVCYQCLKVKVAGYAAVMLICSIASLFVHRYWVYRNTDDVVRTTLLFENPALGFLDCLLNFYLLLLVRSMLLNMDYTMKGFLTIFHLKLKDEVADDNVLKAPVIEKEKRIDDVC